MTIDRLIADVLGAPPARGRRRDVPLQATIERQLDRADIEKLWAEPVKGGVDAATKTGPSQSVSPIQRLRTKHHMLAKLIAEGRKGPEIQLITGYTAAYISTIQNDPSFADLLTYYKQQLGEVYLDVHSRLAGLGLDIVDEIQSRLNTDPDSFTLKDLEEIGKMTLDRSGFGPQSSVKHTGQIALVPADQLNRIKQEVTRAQSGRTVPLLSQSDQGAPLGPIVEHEPVAQDSPAGEPGQGDNLSKESSGTG